MKREKNALHLSLQKIRCLSEASTRRTPQRRWVPSGGGDGETVVIGKGGILLPHSAISSALRLPLACKLKSDTAEKHSNPFST